MSTASALSRSVAAFLAGPLAFAAAQAGPDRPEAAEVRRLIEQLGSEDFGTREAAGKRLAEIGEPALAALRRALAGGDPEVRARARNIIDVIERRVYGPQLRLTGHDGEVWGVRVSAEGKRLLTNGADGTMRLWDAATGKELLVFKGHASGVYSAALSADGRRVLSGGKDGTVRLWDARTGKELRQLADDGLRRRARHLGGVSCVAFGPDGRAFSCSDREVALWHLTTGKRAGAFAGHVGFAQHVAYSERAGLAASADTQQMIRLWDVRAGKQVRQLPLGYTGSWPMQVCFSPDGRLLLLATSDSPLRLWDVATWKELRPINVHANCAAFSPDGKRVVTGGRLDGKVRLWDVATGKELGTYRGHPETEVTAVAFFPDGRRIASACYDSTALVWRLRR